MPKSWPVEEFREYLRALMDAARITDYAELSRLTNVSQNQFSNWRRGLAQPSRESLRKIAPVLGVPPVSLYLAAGVNDAEELDMTEAPDFRVVPVEFRAVADLHDDPRLNDEQRSFLRRSVANLVAGVLAELSTGRDRPSGGRRAG